MNKTCKQCRNSLDESAFSWYGDVCNGCGEFNKSNLSTGSGAEMIDLADSKNVNMKMDINKFISKTENEFRKNNCEICKNFDDPEICRDRHFLSDEKQKDWEWIETKLRQQFEEHLQALEENKMAT